MQQQLKTQCVMLPASMEVGHGLVEARGLSLFRVAASQQHKVHRSVTFCVRGRLLGAGEHGVQEHKVTIKVHRLVFFLSEGIQDWETWKRRQMQEAEEVQHYCGCAGCVAPWHVYYGNKRTNQLMAQRHKTKRGHLREAMQHVAH